MPSVLIVDDEANIRSSLEGALGREGYQTDSAASGPMGEQTAMRDFVLLDVWFPEGSGLDSRGDHRQLA
jgi:DNA-binding response OmpR family regulator